MPIFVRKGVRSSMPWLALLLVSALWGIHPVIGKAVEGQMAPLSLTVWRFTLCAVCYIPLYGRVRMLRTLSAKHLGLLGVSALCWAVLYPLCFYQSLRYLPPVEGLLIVNTSPLLAALLAWGFLRERLRVMEWAGILVSFCGIVVLVLGQTGGGNWLWGVVTAAMAAGAFAGYTVSSRFLFQRLPLSDVLVTTSLLGAVGLWAVTVVCGQSAAVVQSIGALTTAGWTQMLYIVLLVSTLAYGFYGYGLTRLPAGISSALTFYPQVVFTALAAWAWWGTTPSLLMVVSACLILGGMGLMRVRRRQGEDAVIDETILYFAYGSCMSPQDFQRTVSDFRIEGCAVLRGYRLAFTRYSEGRMGGVADVVEDQACEVQGVLYRFPAQFLTALDDREGVPEGIYRRIQVSVNHRNRAVNAYTYTVIDKADAEIAPSALYRNIILDGAKLLGIEYRMQIERHMAQLADLQPTPPNNTDKDLAKGVSRT